MTCPICHDTGIAHSAPHIWPDICTIAACTCDAGKAMVAVLRARQMNAELPEADRAMLKLKGMMP